MRKIAFISLILVLFLALVLLSACEEYAGEAFRVIKQRSCTPYEEIHCDGNTLVTSTRLVSCKINIEKDPCEEFCSEVAGDCVTADEWEELVRQSRIQQGEGPQYQGDQGDQGDQGPQGDEEPDIDIYEGCVPLYGEGFECVAKASIELEMMTCAKVGGAFVEKGDSECVVPCEGKFCDQLVLGRCVKCAMPEQEKPQCSDGIDNDKDGLIDFGVGKGLYDPGCSSADDDDEFDVVIGDEGDCDDGKDNDIDGKIDCADSDCAEDPACLGECTDGEKKQCYTGDSGATLNNDGTYTTLGECKAGTQTCSNRAWGACVGDVTPVAETCDGKDNNCNGMIDDGITKSFYQDSDGDGYGNPGIASQRCSEGNGYVADNTDCNDGNSLVYPGRAETCNNVDDDCDGQIDESLTRECYTGPQGTLGVGVCKDGTETCSAGDWGSCIGQKMPGAEICGNMLDDDCDGKTDYPADSCICPVGYSCSQIAPICNVGGGEALCTGGACGSGRTCYKCAEKCFGGLDFPILK